MDDRGQEPACLDGRYPGWLDGAYCRLARGPAEARSRGGAGGHVRALGWLADGPGYRACSCSGRFKSGLKAAFCSFQEIDCEHACSA